MAHLAVVRGLTYTNASQVFKRWLMPTYRTSFRWTGNRADSEEATNWVILKIGDHLRLPELVQVVDDHVLDLIVEAVARHWLDRYGIARVGVAEIFALDATASIDALFDGLTAEMRLLLVLRFLRRRSPEAIAAQLRTSPEAARRRILAALAYVAQRIGLPPRSSESLQVAPVSAYVDDIVARRRPLRFKVDPEAWPAMVGAGHIQAAIAGNDLPGKRFIRSLEGRLEERSGRGVVTRPRIWSA
jgi:DNA-directed RNA polymerase specialized sigma24 family protein